jgi:hypothetical protein
MALAANTASLLAQSVYSADFLFAIPRWLGWHGGGRGGHWLARSVGADGVQGV